MNSRVRALITALATLAVVTLIPLTQAFSFSGYGDVADDAYYAEAVAWMKGEGITSGVTPGCFQPEANITRAETVVMLWRRAGEPTPRATHSFDDVTASWQQAAVSWAVEQGVTTGTSARAFSPEAAITRGDLITMLWRAEGRPAVWRDHTFEDVALSYQVDAVDWAVARNVSSGTSARTFSPTDLATRGQVAVLLWRLEGEPNARPVDAQPCTTPVPARDLAPAAAAPATPANPPTQPASPSTPVTQNAASGCYGLPSGWESYERVAVPVSGGSLTLGSGDYRLVMPDEPVRSNVRVVGGHNVVVVGGQISINTNSPNKGQNMGMKWVDQTGLIHVEGLLFDGTYLTEGMQFLAPRAQAIVQNVRMGAMRGGLNTDLGLNHADYLQIWGGLGQGRDWAMKVCRVTAGPSNVTGFMLKDDTGGTSGAIDVRYVNIELVDKPVNENVDNGGGVHSFYTKNIDSVHYDPGTVWADHNSHHRDGSLSESAVPYGTGDRSDALGTYTEWSQSWITGRVYAGSPPGGDYVPAGSVGIGYTPR